MNRGTWRASKSLSILPPRQASQEEEGESTSRGTWRPKTAKKIRRCLSPRNAKLKWVGMRRLSSSMKRSVRICRLSGMRARREPSRLRMSSSSRRRSTRRRKGRLDRSSNKRGLLLLQLVLDQKAGEWRSIKRFRRWRKSKMLR